MGHNLWYHDNIRFFNNFFKLACFLFFFELVFLFFRFASGHNDDGFVYYFLLKCTQLVLLDVKQEVK